MTYSIHEDVAHLVEVQRRILNTPVANHEIRGYLDAAYAGINQAVQALEQLEEHFLAMQPSCSGESHRNEQEP
jgi:hypothetical protein